MKCIAFDNVQQWQKWMQSGEITTYTFVLKKQNKQLNQLNISCTISLSFNDTMM